MNQQKGFSLIEVLVSLFLVSTIALALLQQQWQARVLAHHLEERTKTLHLQDEKSEALYVYRSVFHHSVATVREEQLK